ncbi:hypothetical protein JW898_01770 [Candidatus Woesearchaeota archaeon]|nr:hypothetical protein [Candidatus Woesearchaeota archaeon]
MQKTTVLIAAALMLLTAGCFHDAKVLEPKDTILSFKECAAAGYPVMESHPRQCAVPGGGTFTEMIEENRASPDEWTDDASGEETVADGEQLVGGDQDSHGCKASAGYRWCEATQRCQRFWEEPCPSELRQDAEAFCEEEHVSAVYICGETVKVVSSLLGGGMTFHSRRGEEIRCPVVGPDSISEECRELISGEGCETVCEKEPEDESHRAEIIAINHVQQLPAYRDFNGRNIFPRNVQVLRCPGCYDVEVVFERDSAKDPDSTTRALMHVKLSNWEVSDVTSTYEDMM